MRVLLADDHPLFLDGLKNLLTGRGVQVVGTARDGVEVLEKARSLQPDVILMDIQMPRCSGLAATRLIKAELPEIKIVMLTMSSDDDNLFEAIKSGAYGYLLKTQDTEAFFSCLTELAQGEVPLSSGLASRLLNEYSRLARDEARPAYSKHETNEKEQALGLQAGAESQVEGEGRSEPLTIREREVLVLIAQGLTYKEVAVRLYLSERTIKYHMGEIIARLHLENRAQVIEYARRSGLI
jgi:two-component system NarL family response regulator